MRFQGPQRWNEEERRWRTMGVKVPRIGEQTESEFSSQGHVGWEARKTREGRPRIGMVL